MNIALIAPNDFTVPPKDYGGIEQVIYDLANKLVKFGHHVILYAKKGSSCNGKTILYPPTIKDISSYVQKTLPNEVDIIHDHTGQLTNANLTVPLICTVHLNKTFNSNNLAYVSKDQLMRIGKGKGTFVHHGIDLDAYPLVSNKQNYLLFMGRIVDFKGTHTAINVAKKTGFPLIIAGLISARGREYFNEQIKPHIDNHQIKYVGPVGGKEKVELLSNARAVLFPSTANETFGLVPIEAMACGTPVVTYRSGALKETMAGFPGLLCNNPNEMREIIEKGIFPSPRKLRFYVREHFSSEIMTENYIKLYHEILIDTEY